MSRGKLYIEKVQSECYPFEDASVWDASGWSQARINDIEEYWRKSPHLSIKKLYHFDPWNKSTFLSNLHLSHTYYFIPSGKGRARVINSFITIDLISTMNYTNQVFLSHIFKEILENIMCASHWRGAELVPVTRNSEKIGYILNLLTDEQVAQNTPLLSRLQVAQNRTLLSELLL